MIASGDPVNPACRVWDKGVGLRGYGQGSGFMVQGSGFRVQDSVFSDESSGSGFRVQDSGMRVQGCVVSGVGLRVWG